MKLLGKEIWDQHVKELRLTPSNAAAGGKYNGQDLKVFLRPENLEKLAPKIPDDEDRVPENEDEERETRSEIIIKYMTCIDNLHTMCVAKSVVPYDVWGILREFREYFTKGLQARPRPLCHHQDPHLLDPHPGVVRDADWPRDPLHSRLQQL